MKAKVVKLADKQRKVREIENDMEYVIVCAECDNDTFEIRSNTHPEYDDDWEVDFLMCAKCGTVIYDGEDEL